MSAQVVALWYGMVVRYGSVRKEASRQAAGLVRFPGWRPAGAAPGFRPGRGRRASVGVRPSEERAELCSDLQEIRKALEGLST